MKTSFYIVLLIAILVAFGCMDMTSENTNYNGTDPLTADLNGDGVVTDEEQAVWNANNTE